jgi:putative transposase
MLAELLEKAGDGDFLRAVAEAVVQLLMESDCRRPDRRRTLRAQRRAYHLVQRLPDRTFDTSLGALQLRIPKLRQSLPSRKRGAATSRRSWM